MEVRYTLLLPGLFFSACMLNATTYYWTGKTNDRLFSTLGNWSLSSDGTVPAETLPQAGDIITLANTDLSTVSSRMIDFRSDVALGGIENNGSTLASSSATFEFFSGNDNTTWNVGDITQNSSKVNMYLRKKSDKVGLYLNANNINVYAGTLRLGSTDTETALTSINVSGTTTVTDGDMLVVSETGGNFGDIVGIGGQIHFSNASVPSSEFQVYNIKSVVSNPIGDKQLLFGSSGANFSYDSSLALNTVNIGDISYSLSKSTTWSVNNLNVKSSLFDGATGTMAITSENGSRAQFIVQNMDVDNLVVGTEGGSNIVAFEIARGSNVEEGSAAGTLKIGNLDVKDNVGSFRLGYLYVTNGVSFTRYKTMDIGSMTLTKEAYLIGENVSVGSINKLNAYNDVYFGTSSSYITNLNLGADTNSVSNNYGGKFTIFAKNLTSTGTINLAPESSRSATMYLNNARNFDGTYENQTVDMDTVNMDSTNGAVTLSLATDYLTTVEIDSVNVKGGNAVLVQTASKESTHIGSIVVDSYTDSEGVLSPTSNNNLTFSGPGDVVIDNISMKAFQADEQLRKNSIVLQSRGDRQDLTIDELNIDGATSVKLGIADNEFNNIRINTVNQGGASIDRSFSVMLNDASKYVSIGEFNITSGVARLNGNCNFEIDTLIMGHGGTGAAELASTSIVNIKTLNKTSTGSMRFGGSSSYIGGIQIDTYNMDSSGWVAFYTPDNQANIDVLNINSGGSLQFYGDSSIGELNVINVPAGTASLQSQDNLLTIGSTNIAGSVSLDGNVQINDSINIKSGGIVTLGSTAAGYTVTAKGITGNTGTWVDRVQASNSVSLVLNGDEGQRYFFDGRIMDFSENQTDPTQLGDAILSLTVNSGIQVLACINSYRGTTTVNGGTLLLNGSPNNMSDTTLGAIVLNGGEFGAVGRSADIGAIKAQSLSWSNGATMLFDINSATEFDQIILSGALTKGTSDAEGLYNFEFTITNGDIAGQEFALITFDSTDFSAEDFSGSFTNMGDNWSATFDVRDNTVYATIIPEPSTYAAILGVITLFAAYMRKRRQVNR